MIERARLARPLPLDEGFKVVEKHLASVGRSIKAFAACELRSPAPFTEQGFKDFNIQFSYTVESKAKRRGFIVAGGGEAQEGRASYRETIVRLGDTSADGMREKVRYVMGEMQRRLSALGFGWPDAISTQVYTVHGTGREIVI